MLTLAALAGSAQAQAADWWWVAGDSSDDAAVFVDAESVARNGESASVQAVRIARDGTTSERVWRGRCGQTPSGADIAAIARFACGTDDDRLQNAALLAGLTPEDAARAIFRVRPATRPRAFAPGSATMIS